METLYVSEFRKIKEIVRSNDICLYKYTGCAYGIINMTLGCKMNDVRWAVFVENLRKVICIGGIRLHEKIIWKLLDVYIIELCCIGECIKIDELIVRIFGDRKVEIVAPNKSRPTRY